MPATADQFANAGTTFLQYGAGGVGTALNPGDTTMTVTTGAGANMPSTFPFMVTLGNAAGGPSALEVVKCTAKSGDTLTIVRANNLTGPDNGTAKTWAIGTTVFAGVTAGTVTNLWTIINSGRPFNVRDNTYGAKGDGVTDDAAAINAALTAAAAATQVPPAAPTLAQQAGGAFAANAVVNVVSTFITARGETAVSPNSQITISTLNNEIMVTLPSFPSGVTGMNVYASAVSSGTALYKVTSGGAPTSTTSGGTVIFTTFPLTSYVPAPLVDTTGGGSVVLSPGAYLVGSSLTMYSHVHLVGAGVADTVIQLKNGANVDVIQGLSFGSLTGTNNASAGIGQWSIRDLTIDGNKANQTVAIANPTVAATTSGASNAGGNLKASTLYTFGYTWKNAVGESMLVSATTGYTPPAGTNTNQITLTAPTLPAGATGTNWYLVSSGDVAAIVGYIGTSATNALAITTAPGGWNMQVQPPLLNTTTQSSGIRVYGFCYGLYNVMVRNCLIDGIYSEFTTASNVLPVGDSLEATLFNVKSHDNNGHGIQWGGPHDSLFSALDTFNNGNTDGHAGIYIRNNSNMQGGRVQITNSHSWGAVQSYALKTEAAVSTANNQWEGAANAQVLLTGSDANHGAQDSIITGDIIFNSGVISLPVGVEVGATGVPVGGVVMRGAKIINMTSGALKFTNDLGFDTIDSYVYQTSGSFVAGTPAANTYLNLTAYGSGTSSQTQLPGVLSTAQSSTAPSVGTGGTISTAGLGVSRVTTAGAVTGVILAVGTMPGQQCCVINESANSITMAASGTSHVADGVSDVIAATTARTFVWDSVTALWYRLA